MDHQYSAPVKVGNFAKLVIDLLAKRSPRTVLEATKYVAYKSALRDKKAMQELRISDSDLFVEQILDKRNTLDTNLMARSVDWIRSSLLETADPVEWLRDGLLVSAVTTHQAVRAIDSLYADRVPIAFDIFNKKNELKDFPELYVWMSFRHYELTGAPLPCPLQELAQIIYQTQHKGYVLGKLEGSLFSICLKTNKMDILDDLFVHGRSIRRHDLSPNRKIALLHRVAQQGDRARYDHVRDEFWEAESPFNQLKIETIDRTYFPSPSNIKHHAALEEIAQAKANRHLSEEISTHIIPVYNELRPNLRFMDVQWNGDERDRFFALVSRALSEKKPFSLIRLGDGEGYAFADQHEFFSVEDQLNRERHWWGVQLNETMRDAICHQVRDAVHASDVLGIPSIHRFVRDGTEKSSSYTQSVQGRGLLQVLKYLRSANLEALYGEEKMNASLFRSHENVGRLLRLADKLVIVSSASSIEHLDALRGAKTLHHIKVPTHFRTSHNTMYVDHKPQLPFVVDDIAEQVRQAVGPGTLVLVSAGIAGKVLIGAAKDAGGVALDVGSVIDDWLGVPISSLH